MPKQKKTIKELEQEVTHLAHLWYEYVSKDHHKDCDCHWSIERRWSYSEKPKWYAFHFGYIFDGREIECETYEQALEELIELMREAFQKELKWADQVLRFQNEYDEIQIKQAKWLKENLKEVWKKE